MSDTFSYCSKNEREMLGRGSIQSPPWLRCTVLRKERLSSQGRQRGYNKFTFIVKMPWYLIRNTFVKRSTQYTSFSSRKQHANAGSERKQFTENASVALQRTVLTHAHTKFPSVFIDTIYERFTNKINGDTIIPSWFIVLERFYNCPAFLGSNSSFTRLPLFFR